MSVTVEVRPDVYTPDRWTAMIVTATGESTSFDCTHLHHTAATAARCVDRVRSSWEFWHDGTATDEYVCQTVDGHVIREARRLSARSLSDPRSLWSTRRYAVIVPPRCVVCACPLTEPVQSDDCPNPEDHEAR